MELNEICERTMTTPSLSIERNLIKIKVEFDELLDTENSYIKFVSFKIFSYE